MMMLMNGDYGISLEYDYYDNYDFKILAMIENGDDDDNEDDDDDDDDDR